MTKWDATAESLGLDPTGVVDAYPAIRGWLDQLQWVSAPGPLVRSGTLDLGPGVYRLGSPLAINRSVRITGAGGELRKPATVLLGDLGTTYSRTGTEASGYGSQLRDLGVFGHVHFYTQVSVSHVYVVGSVTFVGTSGVGNVNQSSVYHLVVEGSPGYGIYIFGADANAIGLVDCRAFGNYIGIGDQSFLGCAWGNGSCEGNVYRGWEVFGQARGSTLEACYSEQGGAAQQDIVEHPCTVIGGTWNKGIGARPGKTAAMNLIGNTVRGRFVIHNQAPSGTALSASLGGTDGWHIASFVYSGGVLVVWDKGNGTISINKGAWNGPLVAELTP